MCYDAARRVSMIFQGEETMEYWSFSDRTGYRWDATGSEYHRGHAAAYKALVHARRNLKGGTQGLKGSNSRTPTTPTTPTRSSPTSAGTRTATTWAVVANFGITPWTNHNYSIQFPSAGTWYAHFNSDQTNYYGDFNNIGPASVVAAGSPPAANADMGRYSALIFSKTPPAASGAAAAGPENYGCDQPVSFSYDPAGGPLAGRRRSACSSATTAGRTRLHQHGGRALTYDTNAVVCAPIPISRAGNSCPNYAFTDGQRRRGTTTSPRTGTGPWVAIPPATSRRRSPPAVPKSPSPTRRRTDRWRRPRRSLPTPARTTGNDRRSGRPPDRARQRGPPTYSLRDPAYALNACFNDGQGGGTPITTTTGTHVQDCHTNTGNAWPDPAQPYGCDPITVHYAPAAGRWPAPPTPTCSSAATAGGEVATKAMTQDLSGVCRYR